MKWMVLFCVAVSLSSVFVAAGAAVHAGGDVDNWLFAAGCALLSSAVVTGFGLAAYMDLRKA